MTNIILELVREDIAGGSDVWEHAISWGFAIAGNLRNVGADIPRELRYSPSPFAYEPLESYEDLELLMLMRTGAVSVADVQYAGKIVGRYLDWTRVDH